ncbi:hypothetical protein J2744_002125 [Halorubrum trapanicum]|uniref:Uncharacterized protein n=1 Tax=Halorubrum trapanicum TaxID=29284 RepID=A0A8J7ULN7_9EURY|nr:hypothetical protein [Halorubrum trapanicum]MBP1902435.1 hypothetical protein [Halorubrum trapanicum]
MSEEEPEDDESPYGSKNSQSEDILKVEYENAKQRLSTQQEAIKSFSEEGARYLRLILVLIGVPIAVLGALDPTTLTQLGNSIISDKCMYNATSCPSIRHATVAGSIGLLTTAIANIVAGGYEAYNTRNMTNPNDIHNTITSEKSSSDYLRTRLQDYRGRIEQNDRIIFSLDRILMAGKISLLFSIIILSMIGYRLLLGAPIPLSELLLVFLSVLLVFGILSRVVPDRISGRDSTLRFDPPYSLEYKDELNGEEEENASSSSEIEKEAQN